MIRIRLLDYLGYDVGEPEVPEPLPKVVVWGEDFYVLNEDDLAPEIEKPRYHAVIGYVIIDTRGIKVY